MARGAERTKGKRYRELRKHHFSEYEARELSVLRKGDSVLRVMIRDRDRRWDNFTKIAQRKIDSGRWRRSEVMDKWYRGLSRWYSGHGWRVQQGPTGDQPRRARGMVNVWAVYRSYEKISPPKRDVSPWIRRRVYGKVKLNRDLIRIQRAERRGGMSKSTIRSWLEEKERSMKGARGQRRQQMQIEANRLRKLL